MTRKREKLTNELISKKFDNQFNLVNYAISRAEKIIKSGRILSNEEGTENPALLALEEVETGSDKLDEIVIETIEVSEEIVEEVLEKPEEVVAE